MHVRNLKRENAISPLDFATSNVNIATAFMKLVHVRDYNQNSHVRIK